MARLTVSERKILQAIYDSPEGQLQFHQLRKAAGLTPRGFSIVWNRLVEQRCVDWSAIQQATITFGGMRALGVTIAQQIAAEAA